MPYPTGPRPALDESRRAELAANLAAVRARIAQACHRAGRAPSEVTLLAVTKTFPATDVRLLAELGVKDIAENRDQEARVKVAACADLDLTWHFVGQLQTNKARSVAGYASAVHSVDRPGLVQALDRATRRTERELLCFVQVRLDDRPGRGGADPRDVPALADSIAAAPWLRLAGVMGIAPLDAEPGPAFVRLAEVAAAVRSAHPDARWLSAGMSDDLEVAIEHGATHVRIGRGLLGVRPLTR